MEQNFLDIYQLDHVKSMLINITSSWACDHYCPYRIDKGDVAIVC